MNTETEKRKLAIETHDLRDSLLRQGNPVVLSLGLPNVLMQLETLLGEARPSGRALTRFANGIFRIVTEDHDLAKSEVGSELLQLSHRIGNLAKVL